MIKHQLVDRNTSLTPAQKSKLGTRFGIPDRIPKQIKKCRVNVEQFRSVRPTTTWSNLQESYEVKEER